MRPFLKDEAMNLLPQLSNARHATLVIARALACSMLLLLTSCGIPPLRPSAPGQDLPGSFSPSFPGADGQENSSQVAVEDFFTDPKLLCVIDQALVGNQELRILNEDVQIARNEVLGRSGAYLPFMTAGGGVGLQRYSRFTLEGASLHDDPYIDNKFFPNPLPNFIGTLNLFWQIDIWRELRNARDAAAQRFLSASEKRNYFVTRLVAEIADNYYGLIARDKRIQNLDNIIGLQQKTLRTAQATMEAGRTTQLPVERFLGEVRKNQSEKLIVVQEIIEVENRINFLAGRFPQAVERMTGDFINLTIHDLSVGVPSQLLLNRPDVRQAERDLAAAGIDIKVARAHFFPRVDINGGVGYQAFNPKYLFWTPDSLIGSIAGDLVVPVLNKRAIKADFMTANARQLEAIYSYQRVILNAFTEVVNRMNMVQNYQRSVEIRKQQVAALESAVDLAGKLFQAVRIEYLDVLFAQRDLWAARRDLIDTKQQQLSAVVNVYQALGGGLLHRPPEAPPVPPQPGAEQVLPAPETVLPQPRPVNP
jgi:NodT family efflux transporter outer membrane factor (OMF) lipoprotein